MNISLNNETLPGEKNAFSSCPLAGVHLAFLVVLFLIGVASNVLLVVFVFEQRASKLSPDKLLILNLAATNLLGVTISLPLHVTHIAQQDYIIEVPSKSVCLTRLFSLFVLYVASLFTLTAVAFDRSDVLKHFQHQRKLNSVRTKYLIFGIWVTSPFTAFLALLGELLKMADLEQQDVCPAYQPLKKKTLEAHLTKITSITTLTLCTATCCVYICHTLLSVTREIRKHRQRIEAEFGQTRATNEVTFTSIFTAISISYILTWLPFGVFNVLRNQILTKGILCAFMWTMSFSYLSFLLIPIIYIVMDKRVRIMIRKYIRCNGSAVAGTGCETFEVRAGNSNAVHPHTTTNEITQRNEAVSVTE